MFKKLNDKDRKRLKRKIHIRKHLHGTAARPRMTVTRSNKNLYVQVIDDDASVTYKLYFFGAEETFISSTSALSTDFDGELPEGAKYFKIAITPANDTKVEWFEINGYVSQLSVVVNK